MEDDKMTQEELPQREKTEGVNLELLRSAGNALSRRTGKDSEALLLYGRRWAQSLQGADTLRWNQMKAMLRTTPQWQAATESLPQDAAEDDLAVEAYALRVEGTQQSLLLSAVRDYQRKEYDDEDRRAEDIVTAYLDAVKDFFSGDRGHFVERSVHSRLKNECVGVLQAFGRGSQIAMETVKRQRTEPLFSEKAMGELALLGAMYGIDIVEIASSDDIPLITVRKKVQGTYISESNDLIGPFPWHMDDSGRKLYVFPENIVGQMPPEVLAIGLVKSVVSRRGLRGVVSSESDYRRMLSQIHDILPPSCIEAARANILENDPDKVTIAERFIEVANSPALILPDRVMEYARANIQRTVLETVNREMARQGVHMRLYASDNDAFSFWSAMEHSWRESRRRLMEHRRYGVMREGVERAVKCFRKNGSPYVIVPLGTCSTPMEEAGLFRNPVDVQARYLDNSLSACGLTLDAALQPSFLEGLHNPLFIFRNGRLTKGQLIQKAQKENNLDDRGREALQKEYRKVADRPIIVTPIRTPAQEEGGISRYLSFIMPSAEELKGGMRLSMQKIMSSSASNLAQRFARIAQKRQRNPLLRNKDLMYCCDKEKAADVLERIDRFYATDYECHGRWLEKKNNRSDGRGINLPVPPSPAVPIEWELKAVTNVVNDFFENKKFSDRPKVLTDFDKSFSLDKAGNENLGHTYRPQEKAPAQQEKVEDSIRRAPVKEPEQRISSSRKLERGDCSDRLLDKLYSAGVRDAVALYARRDVLALSEAERKAVDRMILAKGVGKVPYDDTLEKECSRAYYRYLNTGELISYDLSRKVALCRDNVPEDCCLMRIRSLIAGSTTLEQERERCNREFSVMEQQRLNKALSQSGAPFSEVVSLCLVNPPYEDGGRQCSWQCKGVREVTLKGADGSLVKASAEGGDLTLSGGWKVTLSDGTTYDLNKGVYDTRTRKTAPVREQQSKRKSASKGIS